MKKVFKLLPVLIAVIVLHACTRKGQICVNPTPNAESIFTTLTCAIDSSQVKTTIPEGDFVIVRSQADFDKLIDPSDCLEVDFAKNDVVVGREDLSGNHVSTNYTLTENCETNHLELDVSFELGIALVFATRIYGVVVPKLSEGQTVNVVVNR